MSSRLLLAFAALTAAFMLAACGAADAPPAQAPAVKPPEPDTRKRASTLPTDRAGHIATTRFAPKHRPVYCGGRRNKWVALTFDDGPGPYTRRMVKLLDRANVPATFFVSGRNVRPFRSSLLATQNHGAAIGNHSWSHPLLASMKYGAQRNQLSWTNHAIRGVTDERVRFFRPPYGAHDAHTRRIARKLDMPIILWNVDSQDSLGANSKKIARRVKRGLKPGAIILLHENHGQTLRAIKYTILPALKSSGMTPVTVPQMLAGNPPTAKQLSRGHKGCR
ncbi:MAG: polysaccharide deacetylase family protein [Solirubrobacterales bacterium]